MVGGGTGDGVSISGRSVLKVVGGLDLVSGGLPLAVAGAALAVRDHVEAYDFDGNNQIDFAGVVALFQDI